MEKKNTQHPNESAFDSCCSGLCGDLNGNCCVAAVEQDQCSSAPI